MAGLTAQQIVTLACQTAKVPGMVAQAGQFLNMILSDLCQTYDFQVARGTYSFNFDPGLVSLVTPLVTGSGPYDLPADFLRCQDGKSLFYYVDGNPYSMVPCDLSEFDMLVQQSGFTSYPSIFATDLSISDSVAEGDTSPQAYVWPPPNGTYSVTLRYFRQMADIATPETSATVPWFPNQTYLQTRLSGELMKIADDVRWQAFLGEGPEGAQGILTRYLKLKDDSSNRATTVSMDRRRFGTGRNNLPLSKFIGWGD